MQLRKSTLVVQNEWNLVGPSRGLHSYKFFVVALLLKFILHIPSKISNLHFKVKCDKDKQNYGIKHGSLDNLINLGCELCVGVPSLCKTSQQNNLFM